MKITIDIECSPEEARRFMGLPDVTGMNEDLVAGMAEKLRETLAAKDGGAMFGEWLSGGLEGMERLQKAFWSQGSGRDDGPKK